MNPSKHFEKGEWSVTLKEGYFQCIHDAGFAAVRVPVRWSSHALTESLYPLTPFFQSH
jgi:endoglucanase